MKVSIVLNPANGQPVKRADYQATFGTTRPPYPRNHAGFDRKETSIQLIL